MKNVWSKQGQPKGKLSIKRAPPPLELVAIAHMFQRDYARNPKKATPFLLSAMYRLLEKCTGTLDQRALVKALIPKVPKKEWKMTGNNTLADPQHMIGVKFGSDNEVEDFLKYVLKQEDPDVVDKLLKYHAAFKQGEDPEETESEEDTEDEEDSTSTPKKSTTKKLTTKKTTTKKATRNTSKNVVSPVARKRSAAEIVADLEDSDTEESMEEEARYVYRYLKKKNGNKKRRAKKSKDDESKK